MVKKFYMETKDSTLESAILDVWKNAAENNMSGEDSFEVGTDRYRDHTQGMTPGQQVEEALEMSDEDFDNFLETLSGEELDAFDEGIGSFIQKRTGLGVGGKAARVKHLQTKAKKAKGKASYAQDVDKAKADITKHKEAGKAYKAQKKTAKKQAKAKRRGGADMAYAEYDPTVDESIKINGQEQIKGLRATVLDMWKEAADTHVDPKEREELDKEPDGRGGAETAKKMKRADEPKPMVASEALSAKQKKIDVDGDGEIEASDLAKLRKKGAKKEGAMKRGKDLKTFKPKPKEEEVDEELTIPQAQEFKVASMKHALAKVWGLEEGELPPALKKAIAAKKKNGDEDEYKEESVKNGGKTETGKKMAEIEIDPELKEKNKK